MAEIIPLRCSPHEQAQVLLPWYASGTLDPEELSLVETHLADCAECRADLELERLLASQISSLPLDIDQGWTEMASRLDAPPPRLAPIAFLRRRVSVGWLMTSQVAAAAALLFGFYVALPPEPARQTYRALGSGAVAESGNLLVIFGPDVSERELRAALLQTDARLVDGPNSTGAYVLRVAPANRAEALARLRQMPQIVLAEPVDAGG